MVTKSKAASIQRPRQAVILAGGLGTRMRPLTDDRPKPMIEVGGKPFLEHLIVLLKSQGFDRFLLLLGYLPEVVQSHFGDGRRLGVEIQYSVTAVEDETARRVKLAEHLIEPCFLLMYADNYWPMQMDRMWPTFEASEALAMITVYSNRDGYTNDSVRVDEDGYVAVYDKYRQSPDLQGVEISYALMRKEALDLLPDDNVLFETAVYPELARQRRLLAHVTDHRYYSIGSHRRLPLTEAFFKREPAVLVDRDGVLNRKPPRAEYVRTWDGFEWLPGAREALKLFKDAGFKVIVISNQAGIARGFMSEADLAVIHANMQREAAQAGGRIDAIYYCPHGWDDGCACRKPKPGLLFQAQREHHLDLTMTPFIGDDERDAETAEAAGAPALLLEEGQSLLGIARSLVERRRSGTLPDQPTDRTTS